MCNAFSEVTMTSDQQFLISSKFEEIPLTHSCDSSLKRMGYQELKVTLTFDTQTLTPIVSALSLFAPNLKKFPTGVLEISHS